VTTAGNIITGRLGPERVQTFTRPDRAIEDFVNTSGTPGEIARFTRRYGVLHRDDVEWLKIAPAERIQGDAFCIHCDQWLENQERMRKEWERTGKPNELVAQSLAAHLTPAAPVERAVRAFVRPDKRGFQLELQPDDLLGALWLAFIGFSDRTRKCQNPTCAAPYFLASRRDQKFCNEQCSRLVANRRWWDQHGAEWRRDHKQAKQPKGGK
jgi:hypothetical protein